MREINVKVFTTARSRKKLKYVYDELEEIHKVINTRIRNAKVNKISIVPVNWRELKPVLSKKKKVDWGWFVENFTSKSDGYEVVVFHFSRRERRRWKMNTKINGTYRNDKDDKLEFWLSTNHRQKARKYQPRISEFYRVFIHEFLHGCYRWSGIDSNLVHKFDYDFKKVDAGLYLVDFDKVKK
jgi:hypothetical protein